METIQLQPCAGLANRLRALVSGICGAEDLRRPLRIIWTREYGVYAADFAELFNLPAMDLPEWISIHDVGMGDTGAQQCLTPADWLIETRKPPFIPIAIKSYGQFHQSDPVRWQRWLRALKPHPRLASLLNSILNGAKPVGVHLRRGDNAQAIAQSPTEAFEAAMDAYPDDTVFFVSSDHAGDKARLIARYPGRVLVAATTLDRLSLQGGLQAFLDFLGLARCTEILGSAGSSFSEIAALYGGCKLRVIKSASQDTLSQTSA